MSEPVPESVLLLGAVAYAELAAFTRLAAEADYAPDLRGRAELSTLAAVEMDHYRRIRDHLAGYGLDVLTAMEPFVAPLDAFHRRTAPRDWAESLVSAHLGRGLATDLQTEAIAHLPDPEGELVREVAIDPGHGAFAEREVAAACTEDRTRDRLALWGRRLLGETLAAAATVLDEHPDAAALLGAEAPGGRAAMFKRLKSAHGKRMQALGL